MDFFTWSVTELLRVNTRNKKNLTELPVLTHLLHIDGHRINLEKFEEVSNLMELAFNRGKEIGFYEANKMKDKNNEP